MKTFKVTFTFEAKRFFNKRKLILFLVFIILLAFFIQEGISNYKSILENKKVFQKIEETKVKQYVLYTQYGYIGVSLLYIPSPFSVLFNDSVFDGLISNVNTGKRLDINKSLKGRNFFIEKSGYMNFLGFILLFGVFFGLIFGNDATKNKDYLKFLSSISSPKKLFLATFISRIVLLNFTFIVIVGVSLLWILINNINLFSAPLIFIILGIIQLVSFFFAIGCIIGTIKRKLSRTIVMTFAYFFSVFFVPYLLDKVVQVNVANIEPLYNFELANLELIMSVERRLIEKFGLSKSGDIASQEIINAVKDALNNEHKKIRERENRMKNQILKKIRECQTVSFFFPTLFYISVNRQICTPDGLNFIDFYSFSQTKKKQFIDFYVDKKFLSKSKPGHVESFIKGDENIYYAKSHTGIFWPGIILTLFYISILFMISLKIHSKRFKTVEYKNPEIEFKEEQNSVFVLCKDRQLKDEIFRYYEQQNAICLDKINTKDFRFYGIGLEYMFNYFCSISGVNKEIASENLAVLGITDLKRESHERDTILKIYAAIKITADSEIIVLNDFLRRESRKLEENVFDLLTNLEMEGKKIIYLSTEMYFTKVSLDKKVKVEDTVTFPLFMDKITVR
jgi:hypothetical protein